MPDRPNALSVGVPLDREESDPPDACSALLRAAGQYPGNAVVTVTSPGEPVRLGYPDLLLRARRLLAGLRARGCRTGDAVVLHGLPMPDFFPAFWACLLGGLRPVAIAEPMPAELPAAAVERFAHVCRLLARPLVLSGPDAVTRLRHLTDGFDSERPVGVTGVDECAAAEPAEDVHRPEPDDVALLMLSSGSTGLPKAIQLTHRGLAEFAAATRRVFDVRPEHTSVNWMPLDHSGALLIYHVLEVFVGATNVHAPTDLVLGDPLRWLDLLDEYRAQHSWAPNFAYQLVADVLDGTDRTWDLSGVSTLLNGGEQVTVPVVARFLDATRPFGIRQDCVRPAWGMAETTTALTLGTYGPDALHRLPGSDTTLVSVGRPAPGAAVRVVDEHGDVVPEGRIGRLQVRSCRVTPGYLGDETGTRALFPDHDRTGRTWLDSGDLAFLADGEVVITGRAKDMIILNGHNYFCHEIEDVVAAVPGLAVGRVAACGVPDERTGSERLHVFVATDLADPAGLLGEVRAALFDRLRLSGCRVIAVPEREFPRTPSGKVQRAALREHAGRGEARPAVAVRERGLVERVRGIVGTVLGREVDADTPFYELGLNSVGLQRVRGLLARELDREIAPTAMFRHPTVTALAGHLAGPTSPPAAAHDSPATGGHVAIIGMALRFPGARTLEEYWANLRDGVQSVRRFTDDEIAAADAPTEIAAGSTFQPVGGVLDDADAFDAGFFGVSPREAELTDPAHRLFLECCHHALEHAGYAGPGRRVGVFAGSGMNLYGYQDAGRPRPGGDGSVALQATIGAQPDFLASRVAYRLGLTGPAIGVQTACSTSLVAVHLAAQALLTGDADLALAGAAAVRLPQEAGYHHHPGSILSPTGRCRAFDAAADGTVGGNGVAAVVLKPLHAALADGDTVHAVILGSAVNNDGTAKVGFTAPSVPGQVGVIRQALRRAAVPAATITYVEAHGTGTELGDPVEFDALREAFAAETDRTGFCALGSVKPNVGHLDSCAGMAGLIKTVLMLGHRELVPTVDLSTPNPALHLDGSAFTLATSRRQWTVTSHPRRAGVSALGVGGTNAHVILEEPPESARRPESSERTVLVPVSAADDESLRTLAGRLRDHLRANPDVRPADVAATLGGGRRHLASRLAVVGRSVAELADRLDGTPDQVSPLGPLVFAFSGQDGVRAGLAAELYPAFPAVRDVLDECERVHPGLLAQLTGDEVRDAQPVLFAFQAALVELWRSAGIEPDVVAGHSLGEYAAMYTAGALSLVDGVRLTAARGAAMRTTPPGGVVVVNADADVAEHLAVASGTEIAAVNAPDVHALSGSAGAVSRAIELAGAERIGCVRLDADRAFHTALIEPALAELARQAAAVEWSPLRVPMVSGLDGRLLPAGQVLDGDYLCRHARQPVRFDLVMSTVHGQDVVEVGPTVALSRLARRTGARWLATMPRPADAARGFLDAVGTLFRRGATIDWETLTMDGRRIPLPVYPFRKQTFPAAADRGPDHEPDRLENVRRRTARLLGTDVDAVDPDRTFVNLGGDSLSLMNMTRDLDEAFGVRVPIRDLFGDADTPRKLAALLAQRAPTTPPAAPPTSTDPVADPAPEVAPTPATTPATPADGELRAIVERQLAVAEQMVDRVTTLMSEQLAALGATGNPPPAPAPEPANTAPPVPVPAPSAPPVPAVATPTQPKARSGAVDFSLYFFGDYPDEHESDKYGLITTATRFADRHGFHAVWLPERHFNSFGALFPNPSVLAAALAAQTERIRLHAGSVVLPLHNPIRVAEEWSVVDNLSGGRVGLCVASGWHATDFVLAPDNFGGHRELMYAHLDTVRRLWAGEAVPATSGSGDEVEVRAQPRPLQDMPPMYVAVVGNPDSYRRAAAQDLGVVTNLMAQSVEQLAANIELFRRTRAEHGLDPDAGRVVVLVHTYLGDDLDHVREEAFAPFCAYLRSSLSLFDQITTSLGVEIDLASTPAEDVEFLLGQAYGRYCESRALIGTMDSCADVVTELGAAGADEIACFVDFGVPVDRVLDALPTLDGLRARFTGRRRLTAAERRIWFLDRLYPNQTIYHEPKGIRLTGPLNPDALQWALQRVVDRQPALRSVFRDDGGAPYRTVLPRNTLECPFVDATGCTEEDALREALRTTGRETFDLDRGPLVAGRLIRLSDEHHLLFLSAHHIVFDSSSTAVLVRDVAAYYRSWPADPDGLPTLSTSDIEDPPGRDEDVEFWRTYLAGAPGLSLPTDHPRPANRSGDGAGLSHELDGELVEQLSAFTQQNGVTLFMAMLGAIAAVLGRFGGQDDLVLGTAVSNRPREAADLVGLFLDTVPLRVDLSGDPGFTDLAHRVRDTTTDAYEHRGVPFDELVGILNPERDPARNPLFDVLVEFETEAGVEFAPPDLSVTILDVPTDRAPFDLSLYLTRHPGGLRISVEYDTELFTAATVRRLLDHLEVTLRRAVADPAAPLSRLTAATEAERADLARWQGRALPEPSCLHRLVESQVDRTPDAVAVIAADAELTYRELDERANCLAHWLLARGIGRGDLVAVRLHRGPELIVTLLAVLKAGAAYLPLDPALPQARVDLVLADSSASLLLTDDTLPAAGDGGPADRPPVEVEPTDLAYCIYTSGSSGRPKGVLVPHRGPANVVRWQVDQNTPLRTLQWTSPTFDVSVQEIFGTLAAGACLVLIDDEARHDPAAVAALARRHRVQRLFMPYTPLKYLLEARPSLPNLRTVVSAGESMVLTSAVRAFFAEHPDCQLYNQYGPTEGSIIVTSQRIDPSSEDTPAIGAPISGVAVDVLDQHGEPVPVGATGEIHIGGLAVTNGYLDRAAETAAVFVADPRRPGARRYRTGDLGRWRGNGTIEFLGRRDDQVKIRGYRVEPGETTRALGELPGVRDAAVVARPGRSGEPELVAYVVLEPDADLDTLAPRLRDELPHYLVPHHWVAMDRLPVNPSGKLDRTRLPDPTTVATVGTEPATPTERALHELWCAELGRQSVPVDRSFFALGGHSLSTVRLLNRVSERLDVGTTMTEFFRNPTIRALAAHLDDAPVDTVVDSGPLTGTQRRLWRRHHARTEPAVYNVAHRVDLTGKLDTDALRQAVEALVHRHAALRTRVGEHDGELVQEVLAPAAVPLEVHDVADADAWCADLAGAAFDLKTAPLHRIRLGRLAPRRWVLVVVLHHLVCDGVSMDIVWHELAALYGAARNNREPGLATAVPHTDVARWTPSPQRRAELERFWRAELSEVDVAPRLPTDRPRPAVLSGRGALHESVLPADLADGLDTIAAELGATPYAVLATAFASWLAVACGRPEVVLATSSANRSRPEHEGVVGLVGDWVLVPVRTSEGGQAERVRAFSAALFAALDHQDLPLDEVVATVAPDRLAEIADGPFPTVVFTVVTTSPPRLDIDGVESRVRGIVVPGLARTELYVRIAEEPDGVRIFWEYSTDLFTQETVAAWDAELRAMLESLGSPASY